MELFFFNSIERQRSLGFLVGFHSSYLMFIILLFNVIDDMTYSFFKSKQNLVLYFFLNYTTSVFYSTQILVLNSF